jgi:threonylcarbamoyladenosine tRNA methylthiotransferase CDKAL1
VHISCWEEGCPINLSVTNRLYNYMNLNGWSLHDAESADCIVIVACSALPEMRRGVVAMIEDHAHRHPSKTIIVTCCFVPQDRVAAPNVVYIPLGGLDDFDARFATGIPLAEVSSGATIAQDLQPTSLGQGRRSNDGSYNVMVSAGCLNNCSFCSGKNLFPTVRSVPIANVVAECRAGLDKGYTSFVIGASDVASYGRDIGCNVTDLFSALFSGVFAGRSDLSVALKGVEPSGFLRYFEALKEYFRGGCIRWVELPIQSGSDTVVRAMNRRYRVEDVLEAVRELRALAPAIRITTDMIFCFPTETAEDFEKSLALFAHFDHVNVLEFQPHEWTKAAALQDVFDADERERRRAVVRTLQQSAKEEPKGEWNKPRGPLAGTGVPR